MKSIETICAEGILYRRYNGVEEVSTEDDAEMVLCRGDDSAGGVPVKRVGFDIELLCYSVVKNLNV